MIRHIVLLTFKPEATAEDRQAVRDAVEAFAQDIPDIRALTCGENIGSGPNHHDFAVVADFDDLAAFRRYIDSDAHRDYVAGPAQAVAKLAAIQHEF